MNPDWLHLVASAHRVGAEHFEKDGIAVMRVNGGANNAMYRVRSSGGDFAAKLCVNDERNRARREFNALTLLRRAKLNIAPEPMALDESCESVPFPVTIYQWIEGKTLSTPLSDSQLSAMLERIQSFHALSPKHFPNTKLDDAWFHWFAFEPYLIELQEFQKQYGEWLDAQDVEGRQLSARIARLVGSCIRVVSSSHIAPSREAIALRWAHVDWNLANVVQSRDGLYWVDWEYSGWGDPALELADLRWHIALDGLTETQHRFLRENYRRPDDDPDFDKRLDLWDMILATRWTFLIARNLWSVQNGPDRLRLTTPKQAPSVIRARLVRTIERAELGL